MQKQKIEIVYNVRLKAAIVESGLKQTWIARKIGIDPAVLSGIVAGYRIPTVEQQEDIAGILSYGVGDLF